MTHYAKVNNGIVEQVIVAEADFFTNGHFVDTSPGTWIETSYNTRNGVHYSPITNTPDGGTPLRGNYAGIGYIYDPTHDVFYPPRPVDVNGIPCASWTIEEPSWMWKPPIPTPTDDKVYLWNETTKTWNEV